MTISPPPLQVPPEFQQSKLQQSFFTALINTIYQLWTATYSIRTTARVETTDNAVTPLIRVEVPIGRTVMLDAKIVARRTGGAAGAEGDSAFYSLTGAYKNIGGVLTGIGAPILSSGEDQTNWNVGFSNSSIFAVVTVAGETDNEITWEGTLSTYIVGS